MTARDRKALREYVRWVADSMGLRDWTIVVEHGGVDDGLDGECGAIFGRRHATIKLHERFRSEPAEEQRDTIVHELVHCHLAALYNQAQHGLEDLLGKPADRIFWASFKRNLEYGVDGMSGALAKHLPLIDWPT